MWHLIKRVHHQRCILVIAKARLVGVVKIHVVAWPIHVIATIVSANHKTIAIHLINGFLMFCAPCALISAFAVNAHNALYVSHVLAIKILILAILAVIIPRNADAIGLIAFKKGRD